MGHAWTVATAVSLSSGKAALPPSSQHGHKFAKHTAPETLSAGQAPAIPGGRNLTKDLPPACSRTPNVNQDNALLISPSWPPGEWALEQGDEQDCLEASS